MEWVSNNDSPLYVWPGDTWVNLSTKTRYYADIENKMWIEISEDGLDTIWGIPFKPKTKVIYEKKDSVNTQVGRRNH